MIYRMLLEGFKDSSEILGQIIKKFLSSKGGILKAGLLIAAISSLFVISFRFIDVFIDARDSEQLTDISREIFNIILGFAVANEGLDALTIILWGNLIAALTLPLVSNSILSSYNRSSMVSIKRNDVYKITDSIILQYTSVLTLVQLIIMLVLFSILRYTYVLPQSIYAYVFGLWLLFGLLTVFLAWVLDFILRMYGPMMKFLFVVLQFLVALYIFFLLPHISGNFFGLSTFLLESFRNEYTILPFALASLGIAAILLYGIGFFGLKTLNETVPYIKPDKNRALGYHKSTIFLTLKILFRNGNVRSPILLMQGIIIGTLLITNSPLSLASFVFAIPMVVTLATFINIYGILGSGNSWLFSLEDFKRKSIIFFGSINLLVTLASMGIVVTMGYVLNILALTSSIRFLLVSMLSASIMTIVASLYAVMQPNKYDVHIRGENILPPSRSLFVLLLLILIGGIPALLAFSALSTTIIAILFLTSLMLCYTVLYFVNRYLAQGLNANRIISQTA